MKRKRSGWLPIAIGILLIAAGAWLAAYNIQEDRAVGERTAEIAEELSESARLAMPSSSAGPEAGRDEGIPLSIPDYILDPNREMPAEVVDGYSYIGILTIPDLSLELPVMDEWSYERLRVNPCRYSGSVYSDNMVICAHNYQSHFGQLSTLSIGDEVTFTDMDDNIFHYKIAEVTSLQPTAVEDMTDGKWALSLFTCTLSGQMRVTVRCEKDLQV